MTSEAIFKPEPLNDAELDRLSTMLANFDSRAMNLEQMDGFIAALVCGPELVLPSEYLPEICGRDPAKEKTDLKDKELRDFLLLILRHWNVVADTLYSGEVYLPLLLLGEAGVSRANDWAKGFVRGIGLHADGWSLLVDDADHGGSLIPIFALAHENDPDPAMRPYKEPISVKQREELITGAAAGVMRIYRYFEGSRSLNASPPRAPTYSRSGPKTGRNEPCPCGSGKKFKLCCGADNKTLH